MYTLLFFSQNTLLLQRKLEFNSSNKRFVQIINVDDLHWVCASNIYSPPGVVDVYDSISSFSVGSYDLHKQLSTILKCSTDMTVTFVDVQRQAGSSDCGVFAIAFANALCRGCDPHTISIDHNVSRGHLLACFLNKALSMFPQSRKPRRIARRRILIEKKVKLFCHCRLPYSKRDRTLGPMAQCSKCREWYHEVCSTIPTVVFRNSQSTWLCDNCVHVA